MGVQIMQEEITVQLFEWIDKTTKAIMAKVDEPYLDSLGMTLEAMFHGEAPEHVPAQLKETIEKALKSYEWKETEPKTKAKAIQFALIKGMKESTQQQHSMTPEAIAMFMGYLANKLIKTKTDEETASPIRIFDPAGGTGNLLFHVMDQMDSSAAYASEIDPTLLKLALENANLQEKTVEFFHQDSLQPFLLDPVDLIVSDLPVGYYPDDARASEFDIHADEGHTYAHHLFIEQSITYLRENGIAVFLIPETLFESEQADKLHTYIQKNAQIIGVLQLPATAFATKAHQKSILILRKKGETTKAIKQPLLAMLPSLNDMVKMEDIITKINKWFETEYV